MTIRPRILAPLLAVLALLIPLLGAPPAAAKPGWTPIQHLGAGLVPVPAQNARGDAAIAWVTDDGVLLRTRAAGGRWTNAVKLFHRNGLVGFDVALDGAGRATVVAIRNLGTGGALYARTQTASGWTGAKQLSNLGDGYYTILDVVANERGATAVSFGVADGSSPTRPQVVYRRAGSTLWSDPKVLDNTASAPAAIDVDPSGRVVAAWNTSGGAVSTVRFRSATSTGFWSLASDLSSGIGKGTDPAIDVNKAGAVSVVYGWTAEGSPARSVVSRIREVASGAFGAARTVASTGGADTGVAEVSTAVSDAGLVTAAWIFQGPTLTAEVRQVELGHDEWSPVQTVAAPTPTLFYLSVANLADGSAVILFSREDLSDVTRAFGRILKSGALGSEVEVIRGRAERPPHSTSPAGDVLVAASTPDGVGVRVYDASPPVARMTAPTLAYTKSKSVPAAWSAVDAWSGIGGYVVARRRAPFDGGFGPWGTWLSTSSKKSASLTGAPGSTYCLRVSAKDKKANLSAPSAERCTAVPLDDRNLTSSPGWTNARVAGSYLGTVRRTTERGQALAKRVRTKRLALIASKCPSCGVVEVFLGQTRLARISLKGRARGKVFVPVKTFGSVRTGTVWIIVASSGKKVVIDGLATSQR